jgi:hypothetical protein
MLVAASGEAMDLNESQDGTASSHLLVVKMEIEKSYFPAVPIILSEDALPAPIGENILTAAK